MRKLDLTPEARLERKRLQSREIQKSYRDNHPDRIRAYKESLKAKRLHKERLVKSRYGIYKHELEAMEAAQNGLCALCGNAAQENNPLVIDHCHSTGMVRSFIHRTCNLLIGYAHEDVSVLQGAINYLKRWRVVR